MKTLLGALIVLGSLAWGCGAAPTEVRHETPTPVVTPVRPARTPTYCANFKTCQGF